MRLSIDRRSLLAMLPAAALAGRAQAQALNIVPLPKGETRSVKVAVGGIADITHLAVWYAKFGGYFDALKSDGIDVEVVPFGGGSEWLLALTSGQVQLAHGFYENGVRAHSQGRDIVLVDNILPTPVLQVIVQSDLAAQIPTVKEAVGHSWGFTSFGSATHAVSLRVASHFGVPQASVHWLGVGGTAGYFPSIREKRVDILTGSLLQTLQMVQEGSAKLLQDLVAAESVAEIYGHPYLGPGMLATRAYCDKEPFVTLKVLGAIRKAIAACKSTPAATIAAKLPAEFQVASLVATIDTTAKAFASNGEVSAEAATAMIKDMSDLKLGKGGIEATDTFDNRFIRAINAAA